MVHTIRFGLYNIYDGRNGGLESTLQGMSQVNMDLGIFQETKVTKGIYMRDSGGYRFMVDEALSHTSDSIAMFYRET